MPHICQNLLVRCMDFRLTREMNKWMEEKGYVSDCDLVSLAGAGKAIADDAKQGETLLDQIKLSVELHHSHCVVLMHHSQCGAYAAAYTFASAEEEKAKQVEDMKKAAEIIKTNNPGMAVKLVWANLQDDEGEEIEFEEIA
ncbi:MAG: carbonic anhydrase [Patescibacteria group bacterium]